MKYATYQIEDKTLEFHNSLLGKEALIIDGEVISEKYSFGGTEHYFKIGGHNYSIRPHFSLASHWGVKFKLHKNGLPLEISSLTEKKSIWNFILFLFFSLLAGFAIGYFATKLFF